MLLLFASDLYFIACLCCINEDLIIYKRVTRILIRLTYLLITIIQTILSFYIFEFYYYLFINLISISLVSLVIAIKGGMRYARE